METRGRMPTEKLTLLALLVALQVVMGKILEISLVGKELNFGFLPIVVAAALMGIPGGVVVGALGDIAGSILIPKGRFFPGFTLTAAIVGLLYALPLYRKKPAVVRIILAIVSASLVNLFLNSYWVSILYTNHGYWEWVVIRAPTYLVEVPMQVLVSYLALKGLVRVGLPTSLRLGGEKNK